MATGKRYYWIKLKESFMSSDAVDYLMGQKDGANYVVLYQVLCLKTINTEGRLERHIGEVIIPYDEAKIQRDAKWFSLDTIRVALELYKALGLIYSDNDGVLCLTNHNEMVGSETDFALQKRTQRDNKLQQASVDIVHTDVSEIVHTDIRDRDKRLDTRDKRVDTRDKKRYAENVSMTDDEYQKLIDKYGKTDTDRLIEILDNYKGSSGKSYKSDYRAILNWVVDRLKEEQTQKRGKAPLQTYQGGSEEMAMLRRLANDLPD